MSLLGYGGGPGRKAGLLASQGIDFYQGALQAPVFGQAWGWRAEAGGLRLAARGFSSEPDFEREACCGGHSP